MKKSEVVKQCRTMMVFSARPGEKQVFCPLCRKWKFESQLCEYSPVGKNLEEMVKDAEKEKERERKRVNGQRFHGDGLNQVRVKENIERVGNAIEKGEGLFFVYVDSKGEVSERVVVPVEVQGYTVLAKYNGEWRRFYLDRMYAVRERKIVEEEKE